MLQSYIKTAIRFLRKNRAFSVINVIGLAIGILCCLYIVFYVKDQYSYDRQFDRAADIYRVTTELAVSGDHHTMASSSPPIAPVEIQWWMFVLAGILAMAIALLTVVFQAIKAAVANPVKGLRSE
jgi:ABC-type antimicrobial peptide transport system permease subunit